MTTNTRANGRTTPVILYRTLGRRKLLGFFPFALACISGMPGTLLALLLLVAPSASAWEQWGGDQGGTRFSKLAQITPANVGNLVRAWEFHTGDLESRPPAAMADEIRGNAAVRRGQPDPLFTLQRSDRA
jgi:hypothetical protein